MWPATQSLSSSANRRGFTIVELLIVIVIIGILAAITLVAYNGVVQRARVVVLQSDLQGAATQLELDNQENGSYPTSASAANGGAGLKASSGTTYQYTGGGATYCLTGTSSGVSYYVSNTNSAPQAGACAGHDNGGVTALTCPSGFIVVPGSSTFGTSDFCVAKYEMKQSSSTVPISQASGTPWVSISQTDAITYSANVAGCAGCHLISEAEWLTIAHNVLSVPSNWSGGSVGNGYIYSGHNDAAPNNALAADTNESNGSSGTGNTSGNQRRTLMLTNGEVIWDLAGNVFEWTSGTIAGAAQPGLSGEPGYASKEWNSSSLLVHGMSNTELPSYGTPAASGWTTTQGIGNLYSYYGETSARVFLRSGGWDNGVGVGIFTLALNRTASEVFGNFGFRVAK